MRRAAMALIGVVICVPVGVLAAQSAVSTQPQTAASTMAFDVASVKVNKTGSRDAMWGCRGTDGKTLSEVVGGQFHLVGESDIPVGRCVMRNVALKFIVALAYQIQFDEMNQKIVGGPGWFSDGIGAPQRYDIDAEAGVPATRAALFAMLQKLLAERFAMKVHHEAKPLAVYELAVAKNGPKLKAAPADRDCSVTPAGEVPCHQFVGGFGMGLTGRSVTMTEFATRLSRFTGPMVVDRTGLTGVYDIKTSDFWMPFVDAKDPGTIPTIFEMLQDQFGLKLKAAKGAVDVIVVDGVGQPTAN